MMKRSLYMIVKKVSDDKLKMTKHMIEMLVIMKIMISGWNMIAFEIQLSSVLTAMTWVIFFIKDGRLYR